MLRKTVVFAAALAVATGTAAAPAYAETLTLHDTVTLAAQAPAEVLSVGAQRVQAFVWCEGVIKADSRVNASSAGIAKLTLTASNFGTTEVGVTWTAWSGQKKLKTANTHYEYTVDRAVIPAAQCDGVLTGKTYDADTLSDATKHSNLFDDYKLQNGKGYKLKKFGGFTFTKAGTVTLKYESRSGSGEKVTVTVSDVHSKDAMLKKLAKYAKKRMKLPVKKSTYAKGGAVYIRYSCKGANKRMTYWCYYLNGKLCYASCPWWG